MGTIALFSMITAAFGLLVVGLLVRKTVIRRRRLREQAEAMVRKMNDLITSRSVVEIKKVAVTVNRIRTLARVNKVPLEKLGLSEGRLQSYIDRMHGRLLTILKTEQGPQGFVPAGSWRFEEEEEHGSEPDIDISTPKIDESGEFAPVTDLLLEVMTDGTPSSPHETPRYPDTMEALFQGLTDGDIEGHIEESFRANVLPA